MGYHICDHFHMSDLQREVEPWLMHNFPTQEPWMPVFGLMEELGELAHSLLKQSQGIRTTEDHEAKAMDAVGDIAVFLANLCVQRGWDLEKIVETVWGQVKQRDWVANPETAHVDLSHEFRDV